jgi:superfamily II DNA or RNA helicase
VTKWQEDFRRFFGGGLERIENATIKDKTFEFGLAAGHGFWVVSLELAAMNSSVLEALHPDRAGWDLVIVDEAHRMTPSAESYFAVGRVLKDSPNFLAMTATPHRGNEQYFRSLMHLVDPAIFPLPAKDEELTKALTPGEIHLLRRMKEELTSYDGVELLFKKRTAVNIKVPLSKATEKIVYEEALVLVDTFFPEKARTLGRIVYGKRAASCLHALRETLLRRHDLMGTKSEIEARLDPVLGNPDGDDDAAGEHAAAIFEGSTNARAERAKIKQLVAQIDAHLSDPTPAAQSSKWRPMVDKCLSINGIHPGNGEQAVIFTEYADTADWLCERFRYIGFTAERYSGRDSHAVRDDVRDQFMARKFQIIVSTDAGNEGIDLQSAHVLVNWDIPWSLVTLEQRMGRIHRVGQDREVLLYNVIATDTLEGDTYARLLDRLVSAANEMGGKMFDSLSLIGSKVLAGGRLDHQGRAPSRGGAACGRERAPAHRVRQGRSRQGRRRHPRRRTRTDQSTHRRAFPLSTEGRRTGGRRTIDARRRRRRIVLARRYPSVCPASVASQIFTPVGRDDG